MTDEQRLVALYYHRFGPAIYRRCLKLLRDPDRALDATQDVFLKLTRQMDRLEEIDSALPWIYRTATHHCLNVIRDTTRRARQDAEGLAWNVASPENHDQLVARRLVARVLSRFDSRTQAIAVGVLVDGMQQDEVAALLGISAKTVSRKLERFLVDARKFVARSEP